MGWGEAVGTAVGNSVAVGEGAGDFKSFVGTAVCVGVALGVFWIWGVGVAGLGVVLGFCSKMKIWAISADEGEAWAVVGSM